MTQSGSHTPSLSPKYWKVGVMIKTIKSKLYQEYIWKAVHLIITMYLLYNLESMTFGKKK